jgi:inner membrane protein
MTIENKSVNIAKQNVSGNYFVKILIIAFLAFLLFIPTLFVSNLISERATRYEDVSKEIASKWGEAQIIQGALIAIPYNKNLNNNLPVAEKKYFI